MDKVRKEIVLKEIQYWKEHRLLPEHYCNFLMSLYTEGSETEQQLYEKKSFSFKQLLRKLLYLYIPLQLVITIVVIYFTEISPVLQTLIFTIFVIITLGSMKYFHKKKHFYFHIAMVTCILIVFFASVHLISSVFLDVQAPLLITILLNCMIWFGIGYKLKVNYLTISGVVGSLLLIIYVYM